MLTKGIYMDIWVISELHEQFLRGSLIKLNFHKKVVSRNILLFVIGYFSTPHSVYLNIGF